MKPPRGFRPVDQWDAAGEDDGRHHDPPWMAYAACFPLPNGPDGQPVNFFPTRGETLAPALAVCNGCPVRYPCLDLALEYAETARAVVGVWGGTSEEQRERLLARRRRKQQGAA